MKQVKIKISKTGSVEYVTEGYVGNDCKEVQNVMLHVGSMSCERPTDEAFKSQETPAYNELGFNPNQQS